MIDHIGMVTAACALVGMIWARYSHEVPLGWFILLCLAFVAGIGLMIVG